MDPLSPIEKEIRVLTPHLKALHKLGIKTVEDMLYHFPVRYGDTAEIKNIQSLTAGEDAVVFGRVSGLKTSKAFVKKTPMSDATLSDETGRIKIIWFNQPYIAKMITDNALVRVQGKVSQRKKDQSFYFSNPKIELANKIPTGVGSSLFGEDGDVEYGGSFERYNRPNLDLEYTIRTKFTSLSPEHWKSFGIKMEDLRRYSSPPLKDIKSVGVEAHYFSYYDNWNPEQHYAVAKEHTGFKPNPEGRTEGTYTDFASLDDKTDGFHYYMAFIKFGIGRATADASHQIRDGIITRDNGVDLVHQYDGEFPTRYLKEFLEYMEMDLNILNKSIDKFRRPLIWSKVNGQWNLRQQVKKL